MQKLVECVPNVSEGRDRRVLDHIAQAVRSVSSVELLDVDPGADTNRTVFTFAGPPEGVLEAAFALIRTAAEQIDMSRHEGAHPRMGATDVCPFVPLSGVTMEECVEIARALGERVGRELGIPVYLYEHAASAPSRRLLADIRAGEYEGLRAKLEDPAWRPDFGPASFVARSGATVIGAREFLIAYNVNLNTRDRKLANEIALSVRETGRLARGTDGQPLLDSEGQKVRLPGRLKGVRAVGWYIAEYGRAQVSINLTSMKDTPLHAAFEACEEEARKIGLRATGSELVGLIPKEALLEAGRHFLRKQGKSAGAPERELVHIAVRSLGLDELSPFDPAQRVIEYRVGSSAGQLVERRLRDFVDELSSDSPAPGGGSAAALCGALAAALAAMVANLTVGKKGHEGAWASLSDLAVRAQALKDWFLASVDEDTRAFDRVLVAMRLPQATEADKAARSAAQEAANRGATEVPLAVLERSLEALDLAAEAARSGNPNSVSDAGVAALCARSGAEGAWLNVSINLPNVKDAAWVASIRQRATDALVQARVRSADVLKIVEGKLGA